MHTRTLAALAVGMLMIPMVTSAVTAEDLIRQIANLQDQLNTLLRQQKSPSNTPVVACTMEAKICPDGTAVGRIGPNCAFALCPGEGVSTIIQVGETQPSGPMCPAFDRNLTYGSRGDDVMQLQQFLVDQGSLNATPTGYFGSATRSALARWQVDKGIITNVASGGMLGARSRAWFMSGCAGVSTGSGGDGTSGVKPGQGVFFALPQQGQAPLTVNFSYSPFTDQDTAGYRINFGDGSSGSLTIGCAVTPGAYGAQACPRALTATHMYAQNGTYTATLVHDICRDLSGCMAPTQLLGTVTIAVGGPVPFPAPVPSSGMGILSGTMTIGPICPAQTNPPQPQCQPTAATFAAHPVYVYKYNALSGCMSQGTVDCARGALVATLTPDAQGKFSTQLSPGTYQVDVTHTGIGSVDGAPMMVTITAGATTQANINIDTGIR